MQLGILDWILQQKRDMMENLIKIQVKSVI